jgi:hypothetical protein
MAHTAQIVPPKQPPVAILYLSSGMSRIDLAAWRVDEISVPEVLVQGQIVRIQQACAADLRQGENVQVIRLACAFILQLSHPCLNLVGVEDSNSPCLSSLLSPVSESLVVVEFLKQLPASNETYAS